MLSFKYFLCKIFGGSIFYYYLCKRKKETNNKHLKN